MRFLKDVVKGYFSTKRVFQYRSKCSSRDRDSIENRHRNIEILGKQWEVLPAFITLRTKDAILHNMWNGKQLVTENHKIQILNDRHPDTLSKRCQFQFLTSKLRYWSIPFTAIFL